MSHLKEKFNYNRGCVQELVKKKKYQATNEYTEQMTKHEGGKLTDEKTKDVQLTGKTRRYKAAHTFESKSLFYCTSPGLHLLSICRKRSGDK